MGAGASHLFTSQLGEPGAVSVKVPSAFISSAALNFAIGATGTSSLLVRSWVGLANSY
jgi:hypothetical protein